MKEYVSYLKSFTSTYLLWRTSQKILHCWSGNMPKRAAYILMLACPSNVSLICSYGHMIKMLAKRTQSKLLKLVDGALVNRTYGGDVNSSQVYFLSLGPYIKRQICKKCHLILRPGVTSTVKLKNNHSKHIRVTCNFCGAVKRFPSCPNYVLFYDKIKCKK